MQLAQATPRLDTQFVDQRAAGVVVGGQRIGLATRAVEGHHQLLAQPLAQRLPPDQLLKLCDQLGVPPELELRFDSFLDRRAAQLLQPARLRLREGLVGEIGERWAAPQVERGRQPFGGTGRVAPGQVGASRGHQILEPVEVDLATLQPELIAGRLGHEQGALLPGRSIGLERPPQPRHRHLKRLRRALGRLLPPKLLDQAIARDHLVRVDHQESKQSALLHASQAERAIIDLHLERSEDPEVHWPVPPVEANTPVTGR